MGGYASNKLDGAFIHVGMNSDIMQNPNVHTIVATAPDEEIYITLPTPAVGRYFGIRRQVSQMLFCKIEVYEWICKHANF